MSEERRTMKKSLVIGVLSSLMLCIGLSGCGDKKDNTTASSTESQVKKTVKPTVAKPFVEGVPMQWVNDDNPYVDFISKLSGKNEISVKAQYFENNGDPTGEWSESETGKFKIQKVSDRVYRYTFDSKNFCYGGKSADAFGWLCGHKDKNGQYQASFDAMEIDGHIYVTVRSDEDLAKKHEEDYSAEEMTQFYNKGSYGYILKPVSN